MNRRLMSAAIAAAASFAALSSASAQTAFGVNAAGQLFRFELSAPSVVTTIGPVGFVPEGLDFRPGSLSLYALDVGPNTTQLYTINIDTGAATPVGAGFNSTGTFGPNATPYNLLGNQTFGFDFNPTTLQVDNSMRIRLTGTSGTNMRLHSATGGIAAVDGNLAFGDGSSGFVDGSAYINNKPTIGGTTALYDMDSRNDELLIQNPPNAGGLVTIGSFGVTVNANRNIGFDIYTDPSSVDTTIGGDFGYAVFTRNDAPIGGPLGAYLLYDVNLATGATTGGALVGPANSPFDFEGGFAIAPVVVPEPSALGLLAAGSLALLRRRKA